MATITLMLPTYFIARRLYVIEKVTTFCYLFIYLFIFLFVLK